MTLCEEDPGVEKGLPVGLRDILAEALVRKAGVGIVGDGWKLKRDFDALSIEGLFDLSDMANLRLLPSKKWSLKDLLSRVGGGWIPKPPEVRCGNWENVPLCKAQREYAAVDSYSGLVIYQKLTGIPEMKNNTELVSKPNVPVPVQAVFEDSLYAARSVVSEVKCTDWNEPKKQPGPSKLNAYRLLKGGLGVSEIAAKTGLKTSTVSNYLYECLGDEYALPWEFSWLKITLERASYVAIAAGLAASWWSQEGTVTTPHTEADAMVERHYICEEEMSNSKNHSDTYGDNPPDSSDALVPVAAKSEAISLLDPQFQAGGSLGINNAVIKSKKRRKIGGVKAFFIDPDHIAPDEAVTLPTISLENAGAEAAKGHLTTSIAVPMKRWKDIKAACPDVVTYDDIRFCMLALQQGLLRVTNLAG